MLSFAPTARVSSTLQQLGSQPRSVTSPAPSTTSVPSRARAERFGHRLAAPSPAANAPIQCNITPADWQHAIAPRTSARVLARLREDAGEQRRAILRRRPNGDFQIMHDGEQGWTNVAANAVQAGYTYENAHINTTAVQHLQNRQPETINFADHNATPLRNNIPAGNAMVDQVVESRKDNDRHDLLHKSHTVYRQGQQGMRAHTHLTLENEHVLHLLAAQQDRTTGFVPRGLWKNHVNQHLEGHDAPEIDNLNFFPTAANNQPAQSNQIPAARLHELQQAPAYPNIDANATLSLDDYNQYLNRAVEANANIPNVYGQKFLHNQARMQAETGLNPAQLYLPNEVGHQKKLVEAAMVLHHKGVAPLNLPQATREAFANYGDTRQRQLRSADGQVLRPGEPGWNARETELIGQHFAHVRDAIRNFGQAQQANVAPDLGNGAQPPANDDAQPVNVAQPPVNVAQPPVHVAQPHENVAQPHEHVAQPHENVAQPHENVAQPPVEMAEPEVQRDQDEPHPDAANAPQQPPRRRAGWSGRVVWPAMAVMVGLGAWLGSKYLGY